MENAENVKAQRLAVLMPQAFASILVSMLLFPDNTSMSFPCFPTFLKRIKDENWKIKNPTKSA